MLSAIVSQRQMRCLICRVRFISFLLPRRFHFACFSVSFSFLSREEAVVTAMTLHETAPT